ncbi:MAG: MlaD family protein [Edaphobacter sp.]|jgi:phospholipid/cholesterol/gamma-HCH transport system substrate-binding protein
MSNRNITVGIFVAAGVSLFTFGIFLIGNQQKAFARHFDVYTEFANLDGVAKGAKVRVAGMDAGEVVDIAVPDRPPAKFRLKLRIEQRLHVLVRTDSVVTIATEGVVGDKFLLVNQGGQQTSEAASLTTLPSKEPLDLSDLMEKSAGMLKDVNGMMKQVGGKLNGALDAITTTVNNADDVVVGLKEGKGPAGMLLRDEATAERLRQTVENARQATSALNHASSQADALVSDLRSRDLGQKADDAIVSAKSAAQHIDATSEQLHQTLTKALGPDDRGEDAATNIQQSLSNLDQATGNMAEDTEALKHNFFFRGFFKRRGYYNLTNLKPDQYRHDKLFANPENHREWLTTEDLFQPASNELEMLSLVGKKRLDAVATQLGDSLVASAIVVEGYSAAQDHEEQFSLSRNRAILVSQYLHTRYHLDSRNVGVVSLKELPPPGLHKDKWDGVCMVILK